MNVSSGKLAWYARRLRRMSLAEIPWRVREQALRRSWAARQVRPGELNSLPPVTAAIPAGERRFSAVLTPDAAGLVPDQARSAIIAEADRLLKGEWETLGAIRADMEQPDWFRDPVTGLRSPPEAYAFSLNQRDEAYVGNVKQVWELNRLQHLTLLATAWYLTHDDAYAERVAEQLRSWWQENPFLSGINWTSGIELGIRLINFVWIRRLLDRWTGAAELFERSDLAVWQIRWHQEYLAAFESRGSSANNHVIAEAAGQLAASCSFPWFTESERWRRQSAALLERSLRDNTFPSGINRELASDYHGFVAELGFFAAIEAAAAGKPVSDDCWTLLGAMTDDMAALVDARLQPPRQADSDEGRVVLLDSPAHNRWPALLALGDALFGRCDWWPRVSPDTASTLVLALAGRKRPPANRPTTRPWRFADAGLTILRTTDPASPEIWCRCDGGPHGFLSIAAHAHADALSVEVRHDGVEILADPGTYSYHGEREWRSYFRSTIAHNTAEIGGRSQSVESGPFMWRRQAKAREIDVAELSWVAEHDGYAALRPAASHQRAIRLSPADRVLEITDLIDSAGHEVRLAYHFGPLVRVEIAGTSAFLTWPDATACGEGRMELPPELAWCLYRGETEPILGWYSSGLGRRIPAFALIGKGRSVRGTPLTTRLQFSLTEHRDLPATYRRPVSLRPSDSAAGEPPESRAEAR